MTILPKLKINITKLKKTFLSIIRTLTKFYQKKNFKLKNKESLLTKKIKEELNLLIENYFFLREIFFFQKNKFYKKKSFLKKILFI